MLVCLSLLSIEIPIQFVHHERITIALAAQCKIEIHSLVVSVYVVALPVHLR